MGPSTEREANRRNLLKGLAKADSPLMPLMVAFADVEAMNADAGNRDVVPLKEELTFLLEQSVSVTVVFDGHL